MGNQVSMKREMAQPHTIDIEVLVPGAAPQQKQIACPDGPGLVSCVWVQQQLQQQFGAGDLCHAGSEVALPPVGELQAGTYVYRVFQGGAAAAAAVSPKTIWIYNPLSEPEVYDVTFSNEAKYESWLGRGFTPALFLEGEPPAIIDYEQLQERALYTLEVCSNIPARVKSMEMAMRHLGAQREDELAYAIATDCGPSATIRPDLRVIRDNVGQDVVELDAVVEFDGAFIIGSHKTSVTGDSDVKCLRKTVDEIVAQHPPFQGKRLELAFMTEHARQRDKQRLRDVCKDRNIRLFERNGRSISRVLGFGGMMWACLL